MICLIPKLCPKKNSITITVWTAESVDDIKTTQLGAPETFPKSVQDWRTQITWESNLHLEADSRFVLTTPQPPQFSFLYPAVEAQPAISGIGCPAAFYTHWKRFGHTRFRRLKVVGASGRSQSQWLKPISKVPWSSVYKVIARWNLKSCVAAESCSCACLILMIKVLLHPQHQSVFLQYALQTQPWYQ